MFKWRVYVKTGILYNQVKRINACVYFYRTTIRASCHRRNMPYRSLFLHQTCFAVSGALFFSFSVNGTIFRRLPSEFPPLGQMAPIHAAFKLPFDCFFQIIRVRHSNLSWRDDRFFFFWGGGCLLYCVVWLRNRRQLRLKPPKSADVSLWGNTIPQEMWSKTNSRTHTHTKALLLFL